jgi:hypothetical protein
MSASTESMESLPVRDFCDFIERNIANRKIAREQEMKDDVVLVGYRVVSTKCASVAHFDKHIKRHLANRQKFLETDIADVHSHGTVKRRDHTHSDNIVKA